MFINIPQSFYDIYDRVNSSTFAVCGYPLKFNYKISFFSKGPPLEARSKNSTGNTMSW